jgi:hypothetical protein
MGRRYDGVQMEVKTFQQQRLDTHVCELDPLSGRSCQRSPVTWNGQFSVC